MNDMIDAEIKMIIFDIDGTLAETDDYFVGKGIGIISKAVPFLSRETAEKIVRPLIMAGETLLHAFYRFLDILGMDGVISRIHSRLSVKEEYKYKPVGNMSATMEVLGKYFLLGIISSGGRHSTMMFIEKFGLKDIVSYVVSAEDARFIKPHPMPLLKIAEDAGVAPGNCLMVGDTIFDILCAKRAGACCAAVRSGFDSSRFLQRHHPDILLDSVDDLPDVLMRNKSQINGELPEKPKPKEKSQI